MPNTISFASNTKGEFKKMLDGKSFDAPTSFMLELLQNAYRAKAKNLVITFKEDSLTLKDDGIGVSDLSRVLRFHDSAWTTTNEGFGIGLWSVLGIPAIKEVVIQSKNKGVIVDIDHIIQTDSLDCQTFESDLSCGFEITVKSEWLKKEKWAVTNVIQSEACYMPYTVTLNEELIPHVELIEKHDAATFYMDFDNRLFTARLAVSSYSWHNPDCYYEKRYVQPARSLSYIDGVIELKNNSVDLKAPDRKKIIDNTKKDRLDAKLEECSKILYKTYFRTVAQEMKVLEKYEDAFSKYVDTAELEKWLPLDASLMAFLQPEKKPREEHCVYIPPRIVSENTEDTPYTERSTTDQAPVVSQQTSHKEAPQAPTTEKHDAYDSTPPTPSVVTPQKPTYNAPSKDTISAALVPVSYTDSCVITNTTTVHSPTATLKQFLKKQKSLVWVEQYNMENYKDLIALAEYYGIKVYKTQNALYERVLLTAGIPYISTLDGAIHKNYEFKEVGVKTKKEASFIQMLTPIRELYDLPLGTFNIGLIEESVRVEVDGKTILNKKDKHGVHAVVNMETGGIIFDRRSIALKKFNLTGEFIGRGELKCLMYNLTTISHELAHLIYKTVDNTELHTKWENHIREQIISLYITL